MSRSTSGVLPALAMLLSLTVLSSVSSSPCKPASAARNFTLPPLPFAYEALEPVISNQTNHFHHGVHHASSVRNLNTALNGFFNGTADLTGLLSKVGKNDWSDAQELQIRNNGGGHWNHAMFWKVLAPTNSTDTLESAISPALKAAIDKAFTSFTAFKANFSATAAARFGSGWAWLCVQKPKNNLVVLSTPNQDNPIMPVVSKNPCVPVLGLDVWEHAYYLRWGPSRAGYIANFWWIVNWTQVSVNYAEAIKKNPDYGVISVNF